MSLVKTENLEQWGRTVQAQHRLATLIVQLVNGSFPFGSIERIRFLQDSATQLPGFDGELQSKQWNQFIPLGASVWELGTGGGDKEKIASDFRNSKKKDLPEGWVRANTTYVAVTLAKLQDADGLASSMAKESDWSGVRVIDAVQLVHWFDLVPTADIRAIEEIKGTLPEGLSTLAHSWESWSSATQPKMSLGLLRVAREEDARSIADEITRLSEIQIDCDSPDEVVGFILGAIQSLPPPQCDELLARSLVLSTEKAVEYIVRYEPQLLILKGDAVGKAATLRNAGHRVVRLQGKSAISRRSGHRLSRQPRREFKNALVEMGIPEEHAEIEARACGASASIWRVWNQISTGAITRVEQTWAQAAHAATVVPVVFAGGWDEANEVDRKVLSILGGCEYSALRSALGLLSGSSESFVQLAGDVVVVAAPATAFALVSRHAGREMLSRFTQAATLVFSQLDPAVMTPISERAFESFPKQGFASEWLRNGMAETLLHIAVLGRDLENTHAIDGGRSSQDYVNHLVRTLPGLAGDYRLIASLRDQLPVLVEAAPIPFLDALETLVQGERQGLSEMFAEGGSFGGYTLHAGLLWALEGLAWQPPLLVRTTLLLGALAEIDPGGNTSNRPKNSLVDIFLAWMPGTDATIAQRFEAIDALALRLPPVAWEVLLDLMPKSHGWSSGTHRPLWRECGYVRGASPPGSEIRTLYVGYIDRAVELCTGHPSRIAELVGKYADITDVQRKNLERKIVEFAEQPDSPSEGVESIRNALREFISRHREFEEAAWALPEDVLTRLSDLYDRLLPSDQIARIRWLFDDPMPNLPTLHSLHRTNELYKVAIRDERVAAVVGLWNGDPSSLDALINVVAFPGQIAAPIVEIERSIDTLVRLFARHCTGTERQRAFASALSSASRDLHGSDWTKAVLAAIDNECLAVALRFYPDTMETFELAASRGADCERAFWALHDGVIRTADEETNRFAVRKLASNGRARDAVVSIANSQLKKTLPPPEIIDTIRASVEEIARHGPQSGRNTAYWIEELLEGLRQDPAVDRSALTQLEYMCLPLMSPTLEEKTLTIHEFLSKDPSFFVDVLCDLYRPEGQNSESDNVPSEAAQSRAHYAWELLHSWRVPPGLTRENSINVSELDHWIDAARALALEKQRSRVGDHHIGNVLFHSPLDPDDSAWPHKGVRLVLERLQSDEIESGIRTESFNSRGVTQRGMFEGGVQERELADRWRAWTGVVGIRYPRTHRLLSRIVEDWDEQAKREDVDADKNQLRHR